MSDPTVPVEPSLDMDAPENPTEPIVGRVFMDHHMHPRGTMIEVPGLGGIPNGGSKYILMSQAMMYEAQTPSKWPVKDGKAQDLHITILTEEEQREADKAKAAKTEETE